MPQNSMCSAGRPIKADTVLCQCVHASMPQVCRPSPRASSITRCTVFARNTDRMIELRADLAAAGIIWLLEGLRVDLVLGPLPSRVRRRIGADAGLEVFERRTGKRMHPPRLQ